MRLSFLVMGKNDHNLLRMMLQRHARWKSGPLGPRKGSRKDLKKALSSRHRPARSAAERVDSSKPGPKRVDVALLW
jgi:hypothetical protein